MVSLTKGEGFGRPLLEFTLTKKPLITTAWSGHVDFLDSSKSITLDGQLTAVEKGSFPDNFYVEGAQWFTVNYQKASQTLRTVYRSYKKYTSDAKKLAVQNKSKFSLDAMTIEFGKILDKYVPEFPKEVKLQLPKLKKVGESEAPKIKLPKLKKV